MRARTTSTTAPKPRYGVPSSALLARADRGFARFLAQQPENQEHDGGQAVPAPAAHPATAPTRL
ncbi:hypothetical protein EF903_17885 [Streptomyces sp. WAC05292]|uniref:hypothetical protein n=1 Tax=Streptomyces sp. WAC05292 TaxID=2487418 RepID=UPI000F738FAD|nr:hypothetical protein [Streptomyces sp. WAC05292]RSS87039.1 hypothetical protein EF903_17885 [Streptomyces sp. WAC05292]